MRRASNVILDRQRSNAVRVAIWPLTEPPELEAWKSLDADRYRQDGRPHFFETIGIGRTFEAADLIRRLASLTSLGRLDEVFRQFKLVNVGGDILNFWKR